MITTTDILLERIENIEKTIKNIEQIIKQLTQEYNKDTHLNNFMRSN